MDGCGRIAVPSDTTNVWMNEMELVELFDVIAPTLRAAIRAVYKSGALQPYEAERHIKLPNGYYVEAYALPMVVALAFRIDTSNAARVRNALLFRWATALRVNVSECGCVSIRPCIHTILLARRSAVLLLRAFSFRLWMAGIARSAAFSCLSVSFAPFRIVLRIKVLAVLP